MITREPRTRATKLRREPRAQAAPASAQAQPPPSSAPSPWILNRWRDLLLFVGTPVLLIPLFAAAQARWSAQDIFLFVGAFGAMGHHLPGMIRAYGDRALFERFKTRFIIAPVALLAVCIWSAFYDIQAVQLVALAWGVWHGMMQTYGFSRIYDSKAGGKAAARARADFGLCFTWFIAAVLLSPLRFRSALELYYDSGGPVIQPAVVNGIRSAIAIALAAVTLVFAWRQWSDYRHRRGGSAIKLVLLASSIGFWWYCNNGVQNILVGIALFEVFHDVQYLAIVWIYNRSRVERDESVRGFMRFVFRRSGSLIGVYVGLVLAYGSIALLTAGAPADWIRQSLIGLVTASALLHFYYDGFIWKVRETQTGSVLGIAATASAVAAKVARVPRWFGHGLRWAALILPFSALCAAQLVGRVVPPLEKSAKVAEVLPQDAEAQLNHGKALHDEGRLEEALARYRTAVALKPGHADAHRHLALAYSDSNDLPSAAAHYEKALELDPKNAKAESNYAGVLIAQGKYTEARRRYEHSLSLDPSLVFAHKRLGDLLLRAGEVEGAISHYTEAVRLKPDFVEAQQRLERARASVAR
ncbi:MAG TPA: tetratricopeptide repeat protein [Chthoniobacterales bacterium]